MFGAPAVNEVRILVTRINKLPVDRSIIEGKK